jgi:hypothetical protein
MTGTKMTQKQAVYSAISSVLEFEDGTNIGPSMTKELRAQVNLILFEGFRSATIELDKEYSDSDLKAYVSGLQSNWIRKDKRLNGNTQYVAKNPGSRAGSGDPALKAARALISTLVEGTADHAEVKAFIDTRVTEIAASKAKVTVDYSALPAELRARFSK